MRIFTILVLFFRYNWEGPRSLHYIGHCLEANFTSQACIVLSFIWRHGADLDSSLEILTVDPHNLGNLSEAAARWYQLQNMVTLYEWTSSASYLTYLNALMETSPAWVSCLSYNIYRKTTPTISLLIEYVVLTIKKIKERLKFGLLKEYTKGVWVRSFRVPDRNLIFLFETVPVLHVLLHVVHIKLGEVLVSFRILSTP